MGDPALDIAWIQATASDAFLERFCETYGHERRAIDLHVFTRAQLLSEIALVRWLVHGLHAEDQTIVDDARAMLADLAVDLNGEPLLPSHAAAMGAASINEVFHAPSESASSRSSSHGSASNSRPIKWRDRAAHAAQDGPESGASTQPVARKESAVARKLAEREVDPAAPTERLRLGPDGTLIS